MIKKTLLMVSLVLLGALFACTETKDTYKLTYFDYMYTFIQITLVTTEDDFKKHQTFIEHTLKTYDALTTSYMPLSDDSAYLENIYSINKKIGETVQIDKELYDVLDQARIYQELTNGHFNILIGKASRVWKSLIQNAPKELSNEGFIFIYSYNKDNISKRAQVTSFDRETIVVDIEGETQSFNRRNLIYDIEVERASYERAIEEIELLDMEDNAIELTSDNQKYYVKVSGNDSMIDLGAMSKGYTIGLIDTYLKEEGLTYYSISAGSSTISVGLNINRENENYIFNIALTHPNTSVQAFSEPYGLIKIKNQSISTSGNFEQYTTYQGVKYHHIISPFDLYPVHFYETLTIVGFDAALLDALSTAMFVMDKETFSAFLLQHQDTLNIEIIRYNKDQTIETFIDTLFFEANT
jgi:thiamine biosynthesis lipoprotein